MYRNYEGKNKEPKENKIINTEKIEEYTETIKQEGNSMIEETTQAETQNTKDEKNIEEHAITIYLFHGATCPACLQTIEYMNQNMKNIENTEIRTYEVQNNQDNYQIMQKVAEKLNITANSVPFIVIGDFSRFGFTGDGFLKEEIETAKKDKNYQDIIEQVIKENSNLNPVYETIK